MDCKVEVAIEDENRQTSDSTSLAILTPLDANIGYVILGVFRQPPGAGTSTRCFDDVTVRKLDICL